MTGLLPIPAFDDNYIWLLSNGNDALVVDPGDATPVLDVLSKNHLNLAAILLTHHHGDHCGGISELLAQHPAPVYGPRLSPAANLITHTLRDAEKIHVAAWIFSVIGVPGHTLDHIAFYSADEKILFCGDTLFSAGCGRVFEGTPAQMHDSLCKLAALPDETLVCCAHEYTLSNLRFAAAVEPGNTGIANHIAHCEALRNEGKPTLPSTLKIEKQVNPFLRCGNAAEFASRREWKNSF